MGRVRVMCLTKNRSQLLGSAETQTSLTRLYPVTNLNLRFSYFVKNTL